MTLDPEETMRRVLTLAQRVGDPQIHIPSYVHIGGVSGKTSVVIILEKLLWSASRPNPTSSSPNLIRGSTQQSQIRLGSFIFPPPTSFEAAHECIRIEGASIDQGDYKRLRSHVDAVDIIYGTHCTAYERLFITALTIFMHHAVNLAIIESALGGKSDATNIMGYTLETFRLSSTEGVSSFFSQSPVVKFDKSESSESSLDSKVKIEDKFSSSISSEASRKIELKFKKQALAIGITTICLDHQAHLGNTVELILTNILAIKRPGAPIVMQANSSSEEGSQAKILEENLIFCPHPRTRGPDQSSSLHRSLILRLDPLTHAHNIDLAIELYFAILEPLKLILGIELPLAPPINAIAGVEEIPGRPSRFFLFGREVIVDAAQNATSPIFDIPEFHKAGPNSRLHLVFGFSGAKTIDQHASLLNAIGCSPYYRFSFVTISTPAEYPWITGADVVSLTNAVLTHCQHLGVEPNITHYHSFDEIFFDGVTGEKIIIMGSPYVVSDFFSRYVRCDFPNESLQSPSSKSSTLST